MKLHVGVLALLLLLGAPEVLAQPVTRGTATPPTSRESILSNVVSTLHGEGDTLWVGPYLDFTRHQGLDWRTAPADSLFGTANRVFSMDVHGPVVWAGLGTTPSGFGEEPVPTGVGFVHSSDGGQSIEFLPWPLDAITDTVVVYGVSRLPATPVIVPQQAVPYDINYDPATGKLWVAGWTAGLRLSTDQGRTWRRVVLPPDSLSEIRPDVPVHFRVDHRGEEEGWYNYNAFSVLTDESGRVWAGTQGGLNLSADGGVSWRLFRAGNEALTGNWVVAIEEQPLEGENAIWMSTWPSPAPGDLSRYGVTVTRDGGQSFERTLAGERINDFAFHGNTVYAAARSRGLFLSNDGGANWQQITSFPGAAPEIEIDVLSVATTTDYLWVGTDQGLFRGSFEGTGWTVFRTDVPLHPATPSGNVPDVRTFAYPNPFSPSSDGILRIKFEGTSDRADVVIYDFGMNLVRRLGSGDATQVGENVEVVWDGRDDNGRQVANGPYFYAARGGARTVWGKILVLE